MDSVVSKRRSAARAAATSKMTLCEERTQRVKLQYLSPSKAAGEAPTAFNPPESNLKPPSGDVAEGAVVVGPSHAGVEVEAEGRAKENFEPDGAAGRADGTEKENVGAGFITVGGAGAGAPTTGGVCSTLS